MSMSARAIPAGTSPTADRRIKSNEAADILRVTPETVRDWRASGRLRAVRVGGRWLFREADVLALIAPAADEELTS